MSATQRPKGEAEFTAKSLLCGLGFGVLFGASNAYLGLKAGLTVSTSIPIAVLSVAVFRALRGGTVLEANMAQTVGSASSSLASGTIFTIPALFMWGYTPTIFQVAVLALLGGLLGIFAMIPLRRLLIVKGDAELPYPEGRACAEVIQATQSSSSGGRWIFVGIGVGALTKLLLGGFHLGPEEVATTLDALPNAKLSLAIAPALMAVGYIVGFKASAVMVSGSLLAALFIYPLIGALHKAGALDAGQGVEALTNAVIKKRFVTYIGAGAVAAAGIVTIIKTLPTMVRAFAAVISGLKQKDQSGTNDRTDRDVPPSILLVGLLGIFAALILVPGILAGDLSLGERIVAAIGVIVFGLLFVPVSSRLVGVIGVSSNPTSAMALITLTVTAAIFAAWKLGGADAKAGVLTVGTVVCIAASKAGDISQDLKTGFLLRATPRLQQLGQIIAAFVACTAVSAVVCALGQHPGFGDGKDQLTPPQATLMKTVIEAVLGHSAPWDYVFMGIAVGGVAALAGLPPLPFALGIYLPLGTMAAIFVGGLLRKFTSRGQAADDKGGAGVLCASGFVAGEGLAGVALAGYAYARAYGGEGSRKPPDSFETLGFLISFALMAFACFVLIKAARSKPVSA